MLARAAFSADLNGRLHVLLGRLVELADVDLVAFRNLTGVDAEAAGELLAAFPDIDLDDYPVRSFIWGGLAALMAFYPARIRTEIDPIELESVTAEVRYSLRRVNSAWGDGGGL